jgi:hypothetical protein
MAELARQTMLKMDRIARQSYPEQKPVTVRECPYCDGHCYREDGSPCYYCGGKGRLATEGGEP